MSNTYVLGLDPSMSSFGVSDGQRSIRIETPAGVPAAERAAIIIRELIGFVHNGTTSISNRVFFIEGPSFGNAMAGALWDAGYLMARIDLFARHCGALLYVVPPATLKKWATGKGNTPKGDMALRLYKKWGVEFEDDPGRDKLFAYALYRYGVAVVSGEVEHAVPKLRGQGTDSKRSQRKTSRTRSSGKLSVA